MTTEIPIGPGSLIVASIDAAEELRDPLDGLVERATIDPGAPFAPDVLERLATLKKDDRGAFESLRAQLKEAGCRVTAPRPCVPCRARIVISLSPRSTGMCSPSTTYQICRLGFPTPSADSPRAAGSPCASCIPTKTRCCLTPPGRWSSTASKTS